MPFSAHKTIISKASGGLFAVAGLHPPFILLSSMLNFLTLASCNRQKFFLLLFFLLCFSHPSHAQIPEPSSQPESQPETPATTQPKPITLSGNRNVKLQSVSVSGNLTRFLSDQYNTPGFTVQQQGSLTLQGQVGEDTQVKATLSDQGPVLPGQSQNLSVSLDSKYFGAAFGETSLSFENAELALPNKRLSGLYGYVQIPGKKDEPARFKAQILTAKSKGIPQQDTFTSDKAKLSYQLTRRPVLVGSERVRIESTSLSRDKDYTIDYLSGTLTFKTFLEDYKTIYVDYEYSPSSIGLFERAVLGSRFEGRMGNLFLGTTYLEEKDEGESEKLLDVNATPSKHQVVGLDARYKMQDTLLFAEIAQSVFNPSTTGSASLDDMELEGTAYPIKDGEDISRWFPNGPVDVDGNGSTLAVATSATASNSTASLQLNYSLSAFSDPIKPSFVYAYQIIPLQEQTNWTNRYERLELSVFGDGKGETLNIDFGPQSGTVNQPFLDYFRFKIKIDFVGFKTFSFTLPINNQPAPDLQQVGLPEFDEIQQFRLYVDNSDTKTATSGTLLIDDLKAVERSPLENRWGSISTDTGSTLTISGSTANAVESQSLSLAYVFVSPTSFVETTQTFPFTQSLAFYKTLTFFVSGTGNNEKLTIKLKKDDSNFFSHTETLNFTGFKPIVLQLPGDFTQTGSLLLSSVKSISFRIEPSCPLDPCPLTLLSGALFVDSLRLTSVSPQKGVAYRFGGETKVGPVSLSLKLKNTEPEFASIGGAFLNINRRNMDTSISFKNKILSLSSTLSSQSDKQITDLGNIPHKTLYLTNALSFSPFTLGYNLRTEKNDLSGSLTDQKVTTWTGGVTQTVPILKTPVQGNLSASRETFEDTFKPETDTVQTGLSSKLSTTGKLSVSVGLDAQRRKLKQANQLQQKTQTLSSQLSYSPSPHLSFSADFQKRTVENLIANSKTTSRLGNLRLQSLPHTRVTLSWVYTITNTVTTVNAIATPVETTSSTYGLKYLLTPRIMLLSEYALRSTESSGNLASVYDSQKLTLGADYGAPAQPASSLPKGPLSFVSGSRVMGHGLSFTDFLLASYPLSLAPPLGEVPAPAPSTPSPTYTLRYEKETSTRPGNFDRTFQVLTTGANQPLSSLLLLSLQHRFETTKEASPLGQTHLVIQSLTSGLTYNLSKYAKALFNSLLSFRTDKVAHTKQNTSSLSSGVSYQVAQSTSAKLELKLSDTLYGQKMDAVLSLNHSPKPNTSLTGSLSFIDARDYHATVFVLEGKLQF